MKKDQMLYWLRQLGAPVLTVALGLILVFCPDAAPVILIRILGWVIALIGVICAVLPGAITPPLSRTPRLILCGVIAVCGLYMVASPLSLAKMFFRIIGFCLLIQGGRDINVYLNRNGGRWVLGPGMVMAAATTLLGLALLFAPLSVSRLVMMILGVILAILGIVEILDRLKDHNRLDGDNPNIIDVEKL